MATVSFYRQTTGSTATGAITFDTTNKYIYLGDGSTAHKFDCNNTNTDTKNTAGATTTSSKIYLVGATATGANPQTYCNTSCYAYNKKLYSNGSVVSNGIPYYSSYMSTTTTNRTGAHFAYIQQAPLYNANVTSTDGTAAGITWWKMYGQNVVSSSNMIEESADMGFDYAIANHADRPPLENAKWIDVAIDPWYLAYNANGGAAIPDSTPAFSSYPGQNIVRCYRTQTNNYADMDSTYPNATGMFVGTRMLVPSGSSSSGLYWGSITVELCCNATNAVHVHMYRYKATTSSCAVTGASKYSAKYGGEEYVTTAVALEKFIYPLYIQY